MTKPQNAAGNAAKWWQNEKLEGRTYTLLDRTQFDAVTHIINKGNLGAQERWEAYQRALDALGVPR